MWMVESTLLNVTRDPTVPVEVVMNEAAVDRGGEGVGRRASAGGLEGVSVADTALSDVDGEHGKLVIAGHDAEAWAPGTTFEGAWCELSALGGGLGRQPGAAARRLGELRALAFERLPSAGAALDAPCGMDALRAVVAQPPPSVGADEDAWVIAVIAVAAAAWARVRAGEPPVAPEPARSHAADYLRMATGLEPAPARVRALETYLVTVSDHGMNASTFTARVVASTGSDLVSAVVAAVGALKGPLHGGAPGPVLDMLDEIGSPENAAAWIERELLAGRRIMGMGHRIYRVRDPRAAVLERATLTLGEVTPRLALARAVEAVAASALAKKYPDRSLAANVEFYTAVVLDAVGLPRELFSPTFAVGRVLGWCAHVLEQRSTGRLIRPASRYVGPRPS
jgi:citrate synthase